MAAFADESADAEKLAFANELDFADDATFADEPDFADESTPIAESLPKNALFDLENVPPPPRQNAAGTLWGLAAGITFDTRIITIGDSYLLGYAPESMQTSWGEFLGVLTASQVLIRAQADAGFVRAGNRGGTFVDVAKAAQSVAREADIIIVGGGINDCLVNSSSERMEAAGYALGCVIAEGWPNAEVYVFAPLWVSDARLAFDDADAERIAALAAGLERAQEELAGEEGDDSGAGSGAGTFHIITDCRTWLLDTADEGIASRDGIHPFTAGHRIIAERMLLAIAETRAEGVD